ncbi:MAG TPA: LacI family DNA-binding transcriptional regulator [Candidatus Limnocylindrales bacterium]
MARVAGVSQKTVSRVATGDPGVSEATRATVESAIASLGYRRNDAARQLRPGQRTMLVGLAIGDIGNPWFSELASAVEKALNRSGYLVIIGSTADDPQREVRIVSQLCERRVDGLLVVPTAGDHRYLETERNAGTSIVFLDRPAVDLESDCVLPRHRAASRDAVRHLVTHGHRRIAFVGASERLGYAATERLAGYREALRAARIAFDAELVQLGSPDAEAGGTAMRALLRLPRPPTAVFAANNRASIGVLGELGPDLGGLAIVGFDDFELARRLPIPLTVVANDPAEMGHRAVDRLLRRMAGDEGPARRVFVPTRLHVRGSGEIPPPVR